VRPVECSGAPRDLGRDLGSALRAELRAAVDADELRGQLAALLRARASARLHRDLRRYFPHQSEWLEGLALGAGVPLRALVRALAASCGPDAPRGAALGAAAGTAVRIASAAPRGAVARRVAPEGRFRSVEVALPTATSPTAGVNEAGLAVAVVAHGSLPGRFAPPVALFARDCLERFERVDPALDWCLARPAAPGGSLLLGDAHGELAGVDANGPVRRALRSAGSLLVLSSLDVDTAALAKRELFAATAELETTLATVLASAAPAAGAAVIVDPAGRRLRVAGGEWISVEG
jgi:hypothetical protein